MTGQKTGYFQIIPTQVWYLQSPESDQVAENIETSELNKFSDIFPSPANDYAYITVESKSENLIHINVMDMNGRVISALKQEVLLNEGKDMITIFTDGLPTGMYNVQIISPLGVLTKRFTKL